MAAFDAAEARARGHCANTAAVIECAAAVAWKPAPAQVYRLTGVVLSTELCQTPLTHLLFVVRCSPQWPIGLWNEVVAWPGAQVQEEDRCVSFYTTNYDDVEKRLRALTVRGAQLDLLPLWVRSVCGFGREDASPPLGLPRDKALRRVEAFCERLPRGVQDRYPVLPYQREGVAFGLHRGGRVLFGDEMGLGKTAQALLLTAQYVNEWPLLVIAPSSLRFAWRDQAAQWLPHLVGNEGQHVYVIKHGKDKPTSDARIVVSTYDLLRRYEFLRRRPDGRDFLAVVVDESQNIKDAGSQRTKAVVGICKAARRVILLSGTPAVNRAAELYTQLEALLPSDMPAFTKFAERYCNKEQQRLGRRTVERWGGVRRAAELSILLFSSAMIRRLKRDVLDQLPPKRRMRVPLDPERMDQDVLRDVERRMKLIGPANTAELFKGGSQNCNLPELFRLTAQAKVGAVIDYVDHLLQMGTKFLLFAHHHAMLDALEQKLLAKKVPLIRIDGKTPAMKRPELGRTFQEDERVRVAVLSITAAGVGLTLTAAHTIVFAELYWVPGQLQQAEDRCHRIGQKNCVTVQYLIAKDTLDDVLYKSIEKKVKGHQCDP